jgi:hypothetical protein
MDTNKVSTNPNTKATGNADTIIAGVLAWLVDPEGTRHCTVTGGPGAGKTWMVKKLVAAFRAYQKAGLCNPHKQLTVCGTTHESLAILSRELGTPLETIYSIFGLIPVSGEMRKSTDSGLKGVGYKPNMAEKGYINKYFICDEANYIAEDTLELIDIWYPNVKIIFVGSENQLGTDKGTSKIFTRGYTNFYLNTAFRANNTDVQAVYDNSEEDVVNRNPKPVHIQNPSVFYLGNDDWWSAITRAYLSANASECITLAYTNKRVHELAGAIRAIQGKAGHFGMDEEGTQILVRGSPRMAKRGFELKQDRNGQVYIPAGHGNRKRSYVGASYEHFEYLKSREHKRRSDEIYPSLIASSEASTIHGAQGGTWEYTFLDLPNFSYLKQRDMETYRRMKHVAESRHRNKLFIKID